MVHTPPPRVDLRPPVPQRHDRGSPDPTPPRSLPQPQLPLTKPASKSARSNVVVAVVVGAAIVASLTGIGFAAMNFGPRAPETVSVSGAPDTVSDSVAVDPTVVFLMIRGPPRTIVTVSVRGTAKTR